MIGKTDRDLRANEGGVLRSTLQTSLSSETLVSERDDARDTPTTASVHQLRALLRVTLRLIEAGDFIGLKSRLESYASKKCLAASLLDGVLPGRNGKTLLHIAAAKGSQQMVRLLLKHGANPAMRDNDGRSCDDWVDGMPRPVHRLLVWQVFMPFFCTTLLCCGRIDGVPSFLSTCKTNNLKLRYTCTCACSEAVALHFSQKQQQKQQQQQQHAVAKECHRASLANPTPMSRLVDYVVALRVGHKKPTRCVCQFTL